MNSPTAAKPNILVAVFLRGGADGLNLVGPSGDSIYTTERASECRVERKGDHAGLALDNPIADVDFRLHYKAEKLKALYDEKHLAVVHACGLTNGTRSHFEAMDYMERGTPDSLTTANGWITRATGGRTLPGFIPIVSVSGSTPISLLGCPQAVAMPSVRKMQIQGNGTYKMLREAAIRRYYRGDDPVMKNGLGTIGLLDILASKTVRDAQGRPMDYTPVNGVQYPDSEIGNGLKTLAQLIKMDVGVQFATVDYGGWDTHVNQNSIFPNLVDVLSRSLGAFWDDMAGYQDRLTIVTMSEFGRRLKSNESKGTDHGHGNVMLVLGGQVKGGKMFGAWPGLANEKLDNGVDLAITTDYRSVLGEALMKHGTATQMDSVFPKLAHYKPLGLFS